MCYPEALDEYILLTTPSLACILFVDVLFFSSLLVKDDLVTLLLENQGSSMY